ncbi:MAG: carbohydrate-binding domain-containing protein [Anaerolineae bacterium]|nr:carbohydrate-binding domain-containing protein [Anaerolineae bacterium]
MKNIKTLFTILVLIFILAACSTAPTSAAVSQPSNITQTADETSTQIILGKTIIINGDGAQANGNLVTITSGGTYSLSGELNDGQVDVNTKEKVVLNLNGVTINNSSGPALQITDAKKVTLNLKEDTINSFTDAKSDNENDAAIFTNDTLVIKGSGTLVVIGNNQEGISSDDDLIIEGGTIKVSAPDDGLNAHDDITINDGLLYVSAGGDAIDSNGTLNINGGTIIAMGSTAPGDGGVDAEGIFTLNGGTLIATGNADAAPSSESKQISLYDSFQFIRIG